VPKYHPAVQRIAEELERRIEQGDYDTGSWLPTQRDLAQEFAVDRSIVRLALNHLAERGLIICTPKHRPWVNKPKTTKRLSSAHKASALTLAAILPEHSIYYSSLSILRGINRALQLTELPYRLMIFDNYGRTGPVDITHINQELCALQSVEQQHISGVILWQMGGQQTLPACWDLRERGVPIVFVDRYPPEGDCDFVGVDNRHAAQEAVDYLFSLGHTRIGHVTNPDDLSSVQERLTGYRESLLLHGIVPAPELVYTVPFGHLPITGAAEHFLSLPDPPTAVFAMNDTLAHGLINDLERTGRRVPEDMSVIGFDDVDRFSPRPAILTTMQQPFEMMGLRAAELLLRRLASEKDTGMPYQHILLPTPLIVRSTCQARK